MFGSFLRRSKKAASPEDVSGRVLQDILQSCPRCGRSLRGHEYRLAAATPLGVDGMERFLDLLSAIRNHNWPLVLAFQSWIGKQPNAEVYSVKCPDEQLSLAVISAPFELEEPYSLMHKELIDDAAAFTGGLPDTDTWHPL